MIYLMTKFDEFLVNDSLVRFYHGIDLEFVKNYNKKELVVIFIDDWKTESIRIKREGIIESLLEDKEYVDLESIENDYIAIYQTSGYLDIVSDSIKKRLLNSQSVNHNMPWFVSSSDLAKSL